MAVTYIVQQGPSATGPWTAVSGSPFSSANCTLSGETPNTSYYVQITAQDLVLGISSTPAVFGPYTTLPTSSESPAGTTVTTVGPSINASPTPGSAGSGNILTITAGQQIALNGTTLGGANVTQLYYTGASTGANGATSHTAYQENASGNWFGPVVASGTGAQLPGSPIPAGPAIAISTIGTQTVNATFPVSGVLTGYSSQPTLQYEDNAGAFTALPVSNTVTATTFSFTHPAIAAANASATVSVRDANATSVTATSNTFAVQTVVAGAPGVPTALTSPGQTVSTITLSVAPPTTGGALDFGLYQYLYKTVAAGSYTNGPTVTYITPGVGSFSALGGTWSISAGGVIAFTGTGGPGTSSGVTQMLLISGTVWQFNGTNWFSTTTPGSWSGAIPTSPLSSPGVTITGLANPQSYNIEVEVSNSSGQGNPCAPINAATQTSSGQFTISQGRVLGPNGSPFRTKGVAMTDKSMIPAAQLIATIPGLNVVNFALGSETGGLGGGYQAAIANSAIFSWTDDAVSRGLVVILSDYPAGQPPARTGSDLTNCANWYATLATHYVNQPRVWWTTENEASTDINQYWSTIYAAIRGTGNKGLIWLEGDFGNFQFTGTANGATYANMTGVGFNVHSYEVSGASTQAQADSTKAGWIRNWQALGNSLDGLMPVFMGEGGNGSNGTDIADPFVNGSYIGVKATDDLCTNAGSGAFAGYTYWVTQYGQDTYTGPADVIIAAGTLGSSNTLTSPYGTQIAAQIAANPPG